LVGTKNGVAASATFMVRHIRYAKSINEHSWQLQVHRFITGLANLQLSGGWQSTATFSCVCLFRGRIQAYELLFASRLCAAKSSIALFAPREYVKRPVRGNCKSISLASTN
jgi:hypothetical protein